MYYLKTIEDKVRVPPSLFGSDINDALLHIVREKFEGRVFKDIGIVLSINNATPLNEGVIIPGDGGAYYKVKFDALTFLPYVNEVYLGNVNEIVEFGAFVTIGPVHGLLHLSQISSEKFSYERKTKILTSRVGKKNIKKADSLLVKVSTTSLKSTIQDTKIGLTMRPEGLGKLEWLEADKKKGAKKSTKEKKEGEK